VGTGPASCLLAAAEDTSFGAHRLDKLEPEHLERLYARMIAGGSSPGTAHQANRTIRTALGEAQKRGYITGNPAALAKAPRLSDTEVEPYSVEEVQRLLREAGERRNSARWAVALALRLRQGEVLGLKWTDVDLDAGTLWVRRGRLRPKYAHGCTPTCRRKAGYCPRRVSIRPDTDETKSRAGRRCIGVLGELVTLLRLHAKAQEGEREKAGQMWVDGGWVFATPTGGPINPNTDYHEWKRLLVAAGLRDGRLHDARHGRYGSVDPGRAGASRHGAHGVVEYGDGRSLPAHHRAGQAGYCDPARHTDLDFVGVPVGYLGGG
jgi:integrase